jgi:hypothetical protein
MKTRSEGVGLRAVSGLIIALVCVAAIFNNVLDIRNDLDLQERGQTITASVTDAQARRRYLVFPSFQVQYQFKLVGKWYGYDGSIMRNYYAWSQRPDRPAPSTWANIPESAFNRAKAVERIDVLYLPNDPWINRPAAAPNGLLTLSLPDIAKAVVLVGLLIWGVGMFADALARKLPG